jgi:signal transduction histidine kinase
MNASWPEFYRDVANRLRIALLASILIVPIFFILLNPHFTTVGYFSEMLFSVRIGLQIGLFYWLSTSMIHGLILWKNPGLRALLSRSLKFRIAEGLLLMAVALGLTSLCEPKISGRSFGWTSVSLGFLIGGITFLLALFYGAYRRANDNILRLRAQSAEANLNVLKNQMQPHFLFNSLNALSELIDSDQTQASTMALKLSDLYREILESSKKPLAPVHSEISIVEKYLELEKLRFGERLEFDIQVATLAAQAWIGSLILQTLVENAIKHGVSKSIDGGRIEIEIKPSDGGFAATVRHCARKSQADMKAAIVARTDGEHSESAGRRDAVRVSGTGLSNTRERLQLLYGDQHRFTLSVEPECSEAHFWFSGGVIDA